MCQTYQRRLICAQTCLCQIRIAMVVIVFFQSFVTIQNIGAGTLPPGKIDILWRDLTWSITASTTVRHNGLAAGASIVASKKYYVGPCDCSGIASLDHDCFIHSYNAIVDWTKSISESDERNNTSGIIKTCDGCGPCAAAAKQKLTDS